MQALKPGKRLTAILISFTGCLLLLFTSSAGANASNSEMSIADTLQIEGVVRSVGAAEDMIRVKVKKGGLLTLQVDRYTQFVDVITLQELEKGQRVKVWYTTVGKDNRAVKIEKLPELGC